jgi:DNA-directed RNA polymerase subunit RPC12/RpoP
MENEAPSYTCPRCHRGCMKSTGSDGDWYQMECPDCGHQEEKEAS